MWPSFRNYIEHDHFKDIKLKTSHWSDRGKDIKPIAILITETWLECCNLLRSQLQTGLHSCISCWCEIRDHVRRRGRMTMMVMRRERIDIRICRIGGRWHHLGWRRFGSKKLVLFQWLLIISERKWIPVGMGDGSRVVVFLECRVVFGRW